MESPGFINFKDYSTRYKFIRKAKDILLGEVQLLKDQQGNRTISVKEKILKTQQDLDQEIKDSETLYKLNDCPSVVKFFGYTYKASGVPERPCWYFYELRESLDNDLEREINNKIRNKDVFSEDELWKIAYNSVAALGKMQFYNLSHGNLKPRNVLISKDGEYKIQWSNFHQLTYDHIFNGGSEGKYLLSPELLQSLAEKRQKPIHNPFSSDTFALGMILFSCATLGDIEDLYDWGDYKINETKLATKLNWVRGTYSERFYKLLDKMTKVDKEKRADFWALEDFIGQVNSHQSNKRLSSNLDLSVPRPAKTSANLKFAPSRFSATSQAKRGEETYKLAEQNSTKRTLTFREGSQSPNALEKKMSRLSATPKSPTKSNYEKSPMNKASPGSLNRTNSEYSPSSEPLAFSKTPREDSSRKTTMTLPLTLTRNFAPITENDYRDNGAVLKELEEQILLDKQLGIQKVGVQVKYYSEGSRYEGFMKGKYREGLGVYYYKNGDVYAGQWKNDRFHGRGVYIFHNGERFEGELQNGMKTGQGVYYYTNKNKYLGTWKDDKKAGFGAFYFFEAGEVYEGEWEDGERNGFGAYYFSSGDKFVGQWYKGEKNGRGEIIYQNGARFEGEWRNNKPNGEGLMIYANGDRYKGNWLNGLKSGYGEYDYKDGSRYIGFWENDDKEKEGTFYHAKGDKYSGEWKSGVKFGRGIYFYKDGGTYEGQWVNDLKEGVGVLSLPDGTVYEGEWKAGVRCGNGSIRLPNTDVYSGAFKNDMMHGKGHYRWHHGDEYQGDWVENVMHGRGIYKNKRGEMHSGTWNKGKLASVDEHVEQF